MAARCHFLMLLRDGNGVKKKRWKEGVVVFGRKVTILVREETEMVQEGK